MLGIEIKQHHINNGSRCIGKRCPVALALRDMFPDPNLNILVGVNNIYISESDNFQRDMSYKIVDGKLVNGNRTPMSQEMMTFIDEFDNGWDVCPCIL